MTKLNRMEMRAQLRHHFLEYARLHAAADGRIPTVIELCEALGTTKNTLQRCMNDLVNEKILTRRSRKEGMFLAPKNCFVIGLMFESGGTMEYLNQPSWMAGFCAEISKNRRFLIRFVQCANIDTAPLIMHKYGLDAIVFKTIPPDKALKLHASTPETDRARFIYNFNTNLDSTSGEFNSGMNVIVMDQENWARHLVREAVRCGCRSLFQCGTKDAIAEYYADEAMKLGLPWTPDRLLSTPRDIAKRLPELIDKYNVDAFRCAGGIFRETLFPVLRKYPDFKPLILSYENLPLTEFLHENPWARICYPFSETLEEFTYRMGVETAQKAMEAAENGKLFGYQKMAIKTKHLTDNISGQKK